MGAAVRSAGPALRHSDALTQGERPHAVPRLSLLLVTVARGRENREFLLSLSAGVLSILASLLGILSALIIVWEGDMQTGVAGLIMAFAISPFGLPALAVWLLGKLDELNYALRGFITG